MVVPIEFVAKNQHLSADVAGLRTFHNGLKSVVSLCPRVEEEALSLSRESGFDYRYGERNILGGEESTKAGTGAIANTVDGMSSSKVASQRDGVCMGLWIVLKRTVLSGLELCSMEIRRYRN